MDPVIVQVICKGVDTIRDRSDRSARFALGVVEQRVEAGLELCHAVPVSKFAHPAIRNAAGSLLRAQIPKHGVGYPDVAREDVEQRLVQHTPVVQLEDRDLQTLLEDFSRVRGA